MNRTARILAAALYLGLSWASAGAQVPLVVGSVRDQHGTPIQAASVAAFDSQGRRLGSALTDRTGTFSLPGDGVSAVAVSCRFCLGRRFSIVAGEPVVAILRRFDALFYETPSVGDLASLPYANVESAMALRPFTLLRQTTEVLPGPQLADRGLLPTDALLIDARVPNYDFSFGTSPYYAIPTAYEGSGSIASPADAFRYGDQAGSGIVTLDPFAGDSAGVLTVGGDAALRVMAGSPTFRAVAGISGGGGQSRERADGQWTIPLSDAQTLSLSGGASQYHESGALSTLDGNFSFANLAFDDVQRTTETHAAFLVDRGGYLAGSGRLPIGNVWSDTQFSAGIRTNGSVAAFAEASSRLSTGIYDATALTQPRIAGTLTQNRIDAGIDAVGTGFDATAGVGFFGVGYTGGSTGMSIPSHGHLATPSLSLRLFPNNKFSGTLEASGAFTLPNLWEQYADYLNAGALVYDRSTVYAATLSYTDDARLRASVETASQRVSGNVNGLVTSSGISLAWQLAPAISLRVWTMYVADATVPPPGGPYAAGVPSNVNALWLTYENGSNVRLDAIYRRDLLDGGPFQHVDASMSGPIAGRLRWYAGVEDRRRTTYLGVGLRFSQ